MTADRSFPLQPRNTMQDSGQGMLRSDLLSVGGGHVVRTSGSRDCRPKATTLPAHDRANQALPRRVCGR